MFDSSLPSTTFSTPKNPMDVLPPPEIAVIQKDVVQNPQTVQDTSQEGGGLVQENVHTTAFSPPTPPPPPGPPPQPPVSANSSRSPKYQSRLILSGHSMSISSIKFSPDGCMLASAGKCIAYSLRGIEMNG